MDKDSADSNAPFEDENLLHISYTPDLRPAKLKFRALAFVLDVILVFVLLALALKIILPMQYPEAMEEVTYQFKQIEAQKESPEQLQFSDGVKQMFDFAGVFSLLFIWVFFTASELAFTNGSMGKKMFRLRVINMYSLERPRFGEALLRSAVKAIALLMLIPLLWVNYFIAFFTAQNRAGHDYICKTLVIDDLYSEEEE
tara:strand:+ start:95241 stop:95837 length:597 start_codon:yes stop_codon:yes gene_type:complete